ncbi:NADPH:quinone reductase [Sinomonas cellulolyticus]|uniref:Zinc-binding alcohol dehydrogenase family protein n=1 Tax=Sinomonas cellulolyticus TaxID=2801916 RepID=A0ABS1K2F2_9MICC|nr:MULTISPECIES: zinc-binding alcohol dehydrogenase family protein [Sinomonas]MBL0705846.1 zinc-binding alcohol dehydrogenase family protein [Sinomonas cellulolyticus]GHG42301.1 NADPH:quinone reductase [Sinomonas sp. KCTC 49339]
MRAVVVKEYGEPPLLTEFPDPQGEWATVIAASANPADILVAAGRMAPRRPEPPLVLGLDGVARLGDGTVVQFSGPPTPYGAYAERIPLERTETHPLPAGLDPSLAAALGVSGTAAWGGLTVTGSIEAGESVLVLGANGQVGRVAVQAARLLGAARVVGVVSSDAQSSGVMELGADAVVSTSDLATLADRLREAAPNGCNLVIDALWGPVIATVIPSLAFGARVVQIGNSAGADATISAPAFRSRSVSFLPHASLRMTPAQRGAVLGQLLDAAAAGRIVVEREDIPLADLPARWADLVGGRVKDKLVVVP